jgi:hypothetical protein
MHDTLGSRLSGIASYADGNARLDTPAALRRRSARRTRLRNRGAALLGVTAVTAAAATFGLAQAGGTAGPRPAASALPASARLTSYQSAVLSRAGMSQATVAALADSGLTPAQIQALAQKITADLHKPGLTPAQVKALELQKSSLQAAGLTAAEQTALARQRVTAAQIAALQQAHLSAAQLEALKRQRQAQAAAAAG